MVYILRIIHLFYGKQKNISKIVFYVKVIKVCFITDEYLNLEGV